MGDEIISKLKANDLEFFKTYCNQNNFDVVAGLSCLYGNQEIYNYLYDNYRIDGSLCKKFNDVGGKVKLHDESELLEKIRLGDFEYVKNVRRILSYNHAAGLACLHGHQAIYDYLVDKYPVDYAFCCGYNNMGHNKVKLKRPQRI